MSYGRRRHSRQPGVRGAGPGPRTFSWEQVDAFASASATTWPTGRVPPVQDTMAMLGSVAGLIATFSPVANTQQDANLANRFARELNFLEPYQVAAGRINHNRGTVAANAYYMNALMLAISGNSSSEAEALTVWGDIGRCIIAGLRSIEERYQFAYLQSMQALMQQAQQVSINTSAGRVVLTSGPLPPPPSGGFGGVPGAGGSGSPTTPSPTGGTVASTSLGSQIGSGLGQVAGGLLGGNAAGAGAGAGILGDLIQEGVDALKNV